MICKGHMVTDHFHYLTIKITNLGLSLDDDSMQFAFSHSVATEAFFLC